MNGRIAARYSSRRRSLGGLGNAAAAARMSFMRSSLAGWVANRVDPGMARADDSVADLRARLPAPLVADLAWGAAGAVPAGALAALGLAPA